MDYKICLNVKSDSSDHGQCRTFIQRTEMFRLNPCRMIYFLSNKPINLDQGKKVSEESMIMFGNEVLKLKTTHFKEMC